METIEYTGITPDRAREISQEALDWDSRVQGAIDERVPDVAKCGRRNCRIVFELPEGMKAFTPATQEIIRNVFIRKGWKIANFGVESGLGAILVDIEW